MKITRAQIQLLQLLQEDASLSHEALAERLGRSRQAVGRELKELEDAGVIARRTVQLDPAKVGLRDTVYVLVELKQHGAGHVDRFESTVQANFPNVIEFARLLGDWNVLLKLVVRDNAQLADLHGKLTLTENVARTCGYASLGAPRHFPLPFAES